MNKMKYYNVREAFNILKDYKITSHEESVRRWLRNGTIKGTQPTNRKTGWVIKEKDLFDFIHARMPDDIHTTNDAKEVVDKEAVRSEMWWQLIHKNIFEDYIEPKRKKIKECCEHKGYSKAFEKEVWEQVSKHKRGFRTP